jgi:hypothetical protein
VIVFLTHFFKGGPNNAYIVLLEKIGEALSPFCGERGFELSGMAARIGEGPTEHFFLVSKEVTIGFSCLLCFF